MSRVFVISSNKKPLMPCHPARARELLRKGKAKVFKIVPFTIQLLERDDGEVSEISFKIDPGSKTTGVALVGTFRDSFKVLYALELIHRGSEIKQLLEKRRAVRRNRRQRNTRYRKARFLNRVKPKGWLAPSLRARISDITSMLAKIGHLCPIARVSLEFVKFDTQLLENADISGVEYQNGTLKGYEVKEYLLEKHDRTCVYCGASNVPLEVEHLIPRSKGGSDRISNLAIACTSCNQKKSNKSLEEFVKNPSKLKALKAQLKKPLRDAAVMNAIRWALRDALLEFKLPLELASGGRTKYNRTSQKLPKEHWIDAACVGSKGISLNIPSYIKVLVAKKTRRCSRRMVRPNKYGFPSGNPKGSKTVKGFRTGDIVRAITKNGNLIGRISTRATGTFDLVTLKGLKSLTNHKKCILIQRDSGYAYSFK